MKLIVGLGNPGKQYDATRHNAGFRALLAFHAAHAGSFGGWSKKFGALVSEGRVGDQKVALMMPQTFMNASGEAVAPAVGFWHLSPADVLMVYDELDVPLGSLRIRATGSAGGHNGVKSILGMLGTLDVERIRIGIGTERAQQLAAEDFVLEKFSAEEEAAIAPTLETAVQAIEVAVTAGIEAAANKFGK